MVTDTTTSVVVWSSRPRRLAFKQLPPEVAEEHHGVAFGTLATVNGIGDFFSSVVVGALWTTLGITVAFGYSAVLSLTGAFLVLAVHGQRTDTGREAGESQS